MATRASPMGPAGEVVPRSGSAIRSPALAVSLSVAAARAAKALARSPAPVRALPEKRSQIEKPLSVGQVGGGCAVGIERRLFQRGRLGFVHRSQVERQGHPAINSSHRGVAGRVRSAHHGLSP